MHQEIQVAPVRHHPWDCIYVSVHRHKNSKVWQHKRSGILNPAGSGLINWKGAERRKVEKVVLIALRGVEMVYEGLAKSAGVLRVVCVVFKLFDA